jgi:hypothetical protein
MSKGILLIGFEYKKNQYWKTLPGIIIDLYLMDQFCNLNKSSNITIITDIITDYKTNILKESIINGIVDENILEYIEMIKDNKSYYLYSDINGFKKHISTYCFGLDKIIVYYTGHSKDGYMILPDGNTFSLNDLKLLILSSCSASECDILIITDCCNSSEMNLPYCLYFDNKIPKYQLIPTSRTYTKHNIIYITATISDTEAWATRNGSLFTQYICIILKQNIRSLSDILYKLIHNQNLKYPLNARIYVSYPTIKYLWSWIFGKVNLDAVVFPHINCIQIYKKSAVVSEYKKNIESDEVKFAVTLNIE